MGIANWRYTSWLESEHVSYVTMAIVVLEQSRTYRVDGESGIKTAIEKPVQ